MIRPNTESATCNHAYLRITQAMTVTPIIMVACFIIQSLMSPCLYDISTWPLLHSVCKAARSLMTKVFIVVFLWGYIGFRSTPCITWFTTFNPAAVYYSNDIRRPVKAAPQTFLEFITSDGTGAPGMSKMRGNPPHPALEKASHPMPTAFASRFRLNFSSSLHFAVAYSVFP